METVVQQLLGQGVLGIFLILVIWYFRIEMSTLRKEMKNKSIATAVTMKEKDDKINELNNKIHEMGIESITVMKDFNNAIKGI